MSDGLRRWYEPRAPATRAGLVGGAAGVLVGVGLAGGVALLVALARAAPLAMTLRSTPAIAVLLGLPAAACAALEVRWPERRGPAVLGACVASLVAVLAVAVQAVWMAGVASGGLEGGLTALADGLQVGALGAGMVFGALTGTALGLAAPLAVVVLRRARDRSAGDLVMRSVTRTLGLSVVVMVLGAAPFALVGAPPRPDCVLAFAMTTILCFAVTTGVGGIVLAPLWVLVLALSDAARARLERSDLQDAVVIESGRRS